MVDKSRKPFKGPWGTSYEGAWASRGDRLFTEVNAIPINILSWGPGGGDGRTKREQLGAHMGEIPETSVASSELLQESDERFAGVDIWDVEEVHARELADLVVCLQVEGPAVSPIEEINVLSSWPDIEQKLRVLHPDRQQDEWTPLSLKRTMELPQAHRFAYSKPQYKTCDDMRAQCSQWVQARRTEIFLRRKRIKLLEDFG